MELAHVRDRRDYWLGHVAAFRDSGETHKAYCERHGLTIKTFRSWRSRLDGNAALHSSVSRVATSAEGGSRERSEELLSSSFPAPRDQSRQQIIDLLTSRPVRRRWSLAEQQQAVLDALRSGLPIERYARLNGLTPSALHRWKHKFARPVGAETTTAVVPTPRPASPHLPTFATVSVATPPTPVPIPDIQAHRVEIVLSNGRLLRVGLGVDMGALQRFVAALEQAA